MYAHMCIIQKYHMALRLKKDKDEEEEEETGRKHGDMQKMWKGMLKRQKRMKFFELATHLHNKVRSAVQRVLMSKNPCV